MTHIRTGTWPSSSSSSSSEESQALLRLKAAVGLHPPSDLGGLGGVSSTTYEFGDFMDTLEHDASGDLLLLLLFSGAISSSGWASLSAGSKLLGSCTGLMCTSSARTNRRMGIGWECWGSLQTCSTKLVWILVRRGSSAVAFLRLVQSLHWLSFLRLFCPHPFRFSVSLSASLSRCGS